MNWPKKLPRYVHLDLKGAPPKLSYLRTLLPLFQKWGAQGLVLEYEDTFPYCGDIGILAAPHAYNREELSEFLDDCRRLDLDVIPLIQTFGHAEFILKHKVFSELREHPWYPNCFCPENPGSFKLLSLVIEQILDFHEDVRCIHIGCDEIWQLGLCGRCVEVLEQNDWSKERLFAEFVRRISECVKEYRSEIRVLIWDDMLRHADASLIREAGLQNNVEPVIWHYGSEGCPDVWGQYSSLFPNIWCASAFKGASGCKDTVPDLNLHVGNHKLWLAVIEQRAPVVQKWGGIILTGWSRYDHFGVLCALLPAALPSLALCLCILRNGEFTEIVHRQASEAVGCETMIPLQQKPRPQALTEWWSFPGYSVHVGSHWQANLLALFYQFMNSELYKGWFCTFNVRRGFVNYGTARQISSEAAKLLGDFEKLESMMGMSLAEFFPDTVVVEWLGTHVKPYAGKLKKILDDMQIIDRSQAVASL